MGSHSEMMKSFASILIGVEVMYDKSWEKVDLFVQ